jgi:uncharacterized protein YndB with AHSA1/START domain
MAPVVDQEGYAVEITMAAPVDVVFDALTTLGGLARWWTPTVSGSPCRGGRITFGFAGEQVVMRVDQVVAPVSVVWTCESHGRFPDWRDTTLSFHLRAVGAASTALSFRHAGLVPDLACYSLCSGGWDHYLRSLAADVTGQSGSPYGSVGWAGHRATSDQ